MGRHSADEGAGVDPLVAEALRLRRTSDPGTPGAQPGRRALRAAGTEGDLGWPGEPADGTGLGWPVDEVAGSPDTAEQPGTTERRRGWRRIFTGRAA